MSKSYDELGYAQKLMIDSYGVDSTVPLSVEKGEITIVKGKKVWQYNEKTRKEGATLADVMTQYWKKVETDLRLNKDFATIHKSDPHMLQQPYLFDKKPPGAPATYPFLEKKSGKNYTDADIQNMDYMHNLIKMLHNKDKTIGTSLMDEIKNNTLILQEDPNTMINRKKHYEELANYELKRLFVRGKKRKIFAEPVLQPSIYIDTRKETFETAYYEVAKLIKMTANFTVNKRDDFHPGSRLQRYHNSLYARAQGMLNKISGKQEAINQYRIRHIRREWEHYANMFNYDFMHLPPGYDPLPPTNCWISKTNLKFLKIDRSYHNQLLTKDWDIEDYLYFDPTLLEDAAGYEAWKVWAEKEKKQYAKLCMEEFEKPSDWTLGAGALRLEPGPPFKLNKLGRFRKDGKRARGWSAPSTSSTPPPPPPPPPPQTPPPQTPPPQTPPPTPPATNIVQAAVDQHILDIQATADQPTLDALLQANLTTINGVVRTQLNAAQNQAIGDAIRIQEAKFPTTPTVSPANSAPPSPQQQPPAQQPFSFAKTKFFKGMKSKYNRKTVEGNVLEIVNLFANQKKKNANDLSGRLGPSIVKSIINYYKEENKPVNYIILSPYLSKDSTLLEYYEKKWGMKLAVSPDPQKLVDRKYDNTEMVDWKNKINESLTDDWGSFWMIVSVDELLETPMFKDACGIGGKGGLKVFKKKGDPIDITVDEFKEVVEETKLEDGNIDLSKINTKPDVETELQRMIQPAIGELIFFHRGAVDRATCVTATKCEQEYSDRKDLILKNIADGTYEFDLGGNITLFAPTTQYMFDVKGMAQLLLSCKGNACPPNKTTCGAEHPEVVERFAKEILAEYLTNKGKMKKKSGKEMIKTLMKSNLEKKLKDKAAAILKKVADNAWTLVYLNNELNIKENVTTIIPVKEENIKRFLTGKVFDNFKIITNHYAVDSEFKKAVEPAAKDLVDQLTAKAPAPATPPPKEETDATLNDLDEIKLTVDPTWDNAKRCCRFTFERNGEKFYLRTYDKKTNPDYHEFVTELETCYVKGKKKGTERKKLFKNLMPLHLFTEFNTRGAEVRVKKVSEIGARLYKNQNYRGLKLKFPKQSDAPDKTNNKYFYIQKKRGDSVKKWLEDKYYKLSSDKKKIISLFNENFGKATQQLKAPMLEIKRIRDGVWEAMEQLHQINDCKTNNTGFRFLHRDIKIDNVAVELKPNGEIKHVRLFDYDAVVDINKNSGKWMQKAAKRNQMPMRNGDYDGGAEYKNKKQFGSLMDR